MTRLSGRGLPGPVCQVAVERGIAVPAGDGVLLLTDHYVPLTREPAPTLLVRSPYGRRFPWDFLLGSLFAGQDFHVVLQSCRGTGGSGGRYEPLRNEAADGQAAVAWLRSQPWFTGVLGTIGPSYLGYVQWALAADPPPELRAMVVQVGMADLYEFLYRGGSLALEGMLVSTVTGLEMGRGFWRLIL
ncbi:MAG: CocE/NonD family hydrolase, partial [Streptosporangiaceae bacterium]